MKRTLIHSAAVFMLGIAVHAQLADGDFSSGRIEKFAANINGEFLINQWVSALNATIPAYKNDHGVMTRIPDAAAAAPRGVGQLFGDSMPAGNYALEFDYSFDPGSSKAAVAKVTVFFFNDPDGSGDLSVNDALRLANKTEDFVSSTYKISVLANKELSKETGAHGQIAFTLPENMVHLDDQGGGKESDWLGIRFLTDRLAGNGSSSFSVDNVVIKPAE